MLCRNLCKLVLIVSSAVQTGAEWRDQGAEMEHRVTAGCGTGPRDRGNGWCPGQRSSSQNVSFQTQVELFQFWPWAMFLQDFFFLSEVALCRRGCSVLVHPALLPAPFWFTLSSFGIYDCSFSFVQQPMPPSFLLTLL